MKSHKLRDPSRREWRNNALSDICHTVGRGLQANMRAVVRGGMVSAALWIVVGIELLRPPENLSSLSSWLPDGDAAWRLLFGVVLACAAAFQLVSSASLRVWHYLLRTWFAAPCALAAAIIAWSGNHSGAPQWIVGLALMEFWVTATSWFWFPIAPTKVDMDFLQRSYFVKRLLAGC